jgi:hypothetical protein
MLQELSAAYRLLAGKLSVLHPGKPLLWKNPSSTARTRQLCEWFPRARFIHIVRHPTAVFSSSLRRLPAMLNAFALQRYDQLDLQELVLTCYRELMTRAMQDLPHVPAARLVEVRYEDLAERPLPVLQGAYRQLSLPGWDGAAPRIAAYLESVRGYEPNVHRLSSRQRDRIAREWAFAFERWGYSP